MKLTILLSLFLFILAPSVAIEQSGGEPLRSNSLSAEDHCINEVDCVKVTHTCCITSSLLVFPCEEKETLSGFISEQRVAYRKEKQLPLPGSKSPLYRPPIV